MEADQRTSSSFPTIIRQDGKRANFPALFVLTESLRVRSFAQNHPILQTIVRHSWFLAMLSKKREVQNPAGLIRRSGS